LREKHTGKDWGQTLLFTYRHRRNCLIENKRERLVGVTVSQKLALVSATLNGLGALIEVAKEFFF